MLDYIRASAQSFGVKAAFGLIILVFVFWGVGNFNDRDYSNVVAVVNGDPILAQDFEKAYHNAEEYLLRNNPGMTREQLVKEHLGRQVLREMVQTLLVSQEARNAGIVVTPLELRQVAGQMKQFQDDGGKFDPEAYKRILAARRISPAQYEKDLAEQLLREKMFGLVTSSAWVDPDEALNLYNFLRERRIVNYVFIPAEKFISEVKVTEAEERSWYDSHQADFAIPPKVDVNYISISPELLVKPESISVDDAKKWYESNQNKFERPERVNAAHILVPLEQDASESDQAKARERIGKAAEMLASGKKFASVADEFNSEGAAGKGGELGWIVRGQTVPEFEEAVFSLPPNTPSDVIRTPFGLHIVMVHEKKAAGIEPFEKVENEARKAVAFENGTDKLHDVLDSLIEDNILQKPLADSAAKYGLKAEQSGLMDKKALMEKLGLNEDGAGALLAVEPGSPLDTALEAGDKYIVARITSSEPAGTKQFDNVRTEIAALLKSEKALALAMADAAKLLESIKNETFAKVREQRKDIKTSQPVGREGSIDGFFPDNNLDEAIFAAKAGSWLNRAFEEQGPQGKGAMLVRVDSIVPPEPGEFESIKSIMSNGIKQERMQAIYGLFIQKLADKAKVEVTNQNLIDRVNM